MFALPLFKKFYLLQRIYRINPAWSGYFDLKIKRYCHLGWIKSLGLLFLRCYSSDLARLFENEFLATLIGRHC